MNVYDVNAFELAVYIYLVLLEGECESKIISNTVADSKEFLVSSLVIQVIIQSLLVSLTKQIPDLMSHF